MFYRTFGLIYILKAKRGTLKLKYITEHKNKLTSTLPKYQRLLGPFKYLCFTGHSVWYIFWNRRSYCISVGQDRRFSGSLLIFIASVIINPSQFPLPMALNSVFSFIKKSKWLTTSQQVSGSLIKRTYSGSLLIFIASVIINCHFINKIK
jgi:hypothetical protein